MSKTVYLYISGDLRRPQPPLKVELIELPLPAAVQCMANNTNNLSMTIQSLGSVEDFRVHHSLLRILRYWLSGLD